MELFSCWRNFVAMDNNRRATRICVALGTSAIIALGLLSTSPVGATNSGEAIDFGKSAAVAPPTSADLVAPAPLPSNSVDVVTLPAADESPNEPDEDNERDSAIIILLAVVGLAVVTVGIIVYVKRGGKID